MKDSQYMNQEILERYFLGKSSFEESLQVEQWLSSPDKSEEELDAINAIFDRIYKVNDDYADKGYRKCAERLNLDVAPSSKLTSGGVFPILAVLALAASFFLGVFLHTGREKKQPDIEFTEVYARRGGSETVKLPDGSFILLKSGSSLIYPSSFEGDCRKVFLSGECYASIAKDPSRPFIMSTGMMDVRVTGTEFNIKIFPEDSEAEVALVEGSVQLEGRSGSSTPLQSIKLAPGNVVKVDRKSGETRISEFCVDNYSKQEDKADAFIFLDRRFCDIVSELSRRLDVNIVIADASLRERRYYSSFVNGETLDEMLSTFNADHSMTIRREGGTIRITK